MNSDSCKLLPNLVIWATVAGTTGAFAKIDSVSSPQFINQYKHKNANVPSNQPWIYFLQYRLLCGADTIIKYTDTLTIDTIKPDPTFLDSVSVNPITNEVYLGWTSNKSPDFNAYYIYSFDRSNPILTQTYRDTFYIDNGIDPKTKALSYQITSSDSCDNARPYDPNPHKTIYLTAKIDTCKNQASINWSKYVGWDSISIYYLYRKINSSVYLLLDSTFLLSYLDRALSSNIVGSYFVRAIKFDKFRHITSSSNSDVIVTSKGVNPKNTKISSVTNNSMAGLEINISPNSISNYSSIKLYKWLQNKTFQEVYVFSNGETKFQDLTSGNTNINQYVLIGYNVCSQPSDTSFFSNNIVLNLSVSTNSVGLLWNSYFTWNEGVNQYTTYRSIGDKLEDGSPFIPISTQADTFQSDSIIQNKVVCYYVWAKEKNGTNFSKSNTSCYEPNSTIYYPNVIVIGGVNNRFTFIGTGLNLNNSTLKIYNRWGGLIYYKSGLSDGWDGTLSNNEMVDEGVYVFVAIINEEANNTNKIINGTITVIK